jgi:hypothetical protein
MSNVPDYRKNSKRIFNLSFSLMDDLKCSICLEFYKIPLTLNCQHSFCKQCLEPLVMQTIFSCPECRKSCFFESIEKIPKSIVLANLVSNLDSYKAACPECSQLAELHVCEHCSHIFCQKCIDVHFKNIFEKFDSCISKLDNFPKLMESFNTQINKSEDDVFSKTAKKMESIQSQILSLWHARKSILFEEIRRFHRDKRNELEIAKFRFKILSKNLNEIRVRKNDLAKEFHANLNEKRLIKELVELENELLQLENKFDEDIAFDSSDLMELILAYNETDNIEVFKKILDNVYLQSTTSDEKSNKNATKTEDYMKKPFIFTVDNVRINKEKPKNTIKIEDYMGKSLTVEFDPEIKETNIGDLKKQAKIVLGIDEATYINILDKKTSTPLDDKHELVFNKGKLFSKKNVITEVKGKMLTRRNLHSNTADNNNNICSMISSNFGKKELNTCEEEIELLISYRCL